MATFSLLTLNCFGAPTTATRRRLRVLAQELERRADTIVCLQEVQTHTYRKLLITASYHYAQPIYQPFVHAPKGGLLTLSRLPVEAAQFTLYDARELWHTLAVMDWVLHKGALVARTSVANQPIVVFNTHLTANYNGDWSQTNRYAQNEHRQLQQLAALVRAQPADVLVVVAGDFNIPRGSWLYEEFIAASGLHDPLAHDARPTYRPLAQLPTRFAVPIDFAFVRAPVLPGLQITSDICLNEPHQIGNRRAHLSDHNGIELMVEWDNDEIAT